MSIQFFQGADGREVYKVVTPSGVVGFIATEISPEVLQLFAQKLARKIRANQRRLARDTLAGTGPLVSTQPQGLPQPREV